MNVCVTTGFEGLSEISQSSILLLQPVRHKRRSLNKVFRQKIDWHFNWLKGCETQKAVTQQGFEAEDWLRHSDWLKSCEEQKVVTQQGFQAEDWLKHSGWLKCWVSGGQEASMAVPHGSYSSVAPASPQPAWPSLDRSCCHFPPPRQPLKEPSHIQPVSRLPRQQSASPKRQASLFKALTDLGQVPVRGSKYADCYCYINTSLLLLLYKHLIVII